MKLSIRQKHLKQSDELHALIERRVNFALSRFGPRISSVSVFVEDNNGPHQGIDQHCRITIKMDRTNELAVEATDATIHAAIALAADRAGRVVRRELERLRSIRDYSSRPRFDESRSGSENSE